LINLTIKKIKLNKGFSVLEVLISSLILLLLMSIASEIMYQSLRVSREENGLAFIRKEAVKGITWITGDLRKTNGTSLLYNISPVIDVPVAISFLTNQGNDLAGMGSTDTKASPNWKNYVVYYLKPDPKNPASPGKTQKYLLKRRTILPSDTYYQGVFNDSMSLSKPLQMLDVTYVCNESGTEKPRTIARNIYHIDIIEKEKNYFTLTIETRDKSPRERDENPEGGEIKAVYTSRVLMRNTILQSH
jgi:prepilin-type N-terminal cleavage/methylation domain-containing protein